MKTNPTAGILLLLLGALIITQGPKLLTGLFKNTGNTIPGSNDPNSPNYIGDTTPDKDSFQSGGETDPDAKDPNKPGGTVTNTALKWPGAYVGEKGAKII